MCLYIYTNQPRLNSFLEIIETFAIELSNLHLGFVVYRYDHALTCFGDRTEAIHLLLRPSFVQIYYPMRAMERCVLSKIDEKKISVRKRSRLYVKILIRHDVHDGQENGIKSAISTRT